MNKTSNARNPSLHQGSQLNVTEDDLVEAKAIAATLSLEGVRKMMQNVLKIHDRDPNFPHSVLIKIHEFLGQSLVRLTSVFTQR